MISYHHDENDKKKPVGVVRKPGEAVDTIRSRLTRTTHPVKMDETRQSHYPRAVDADVHPDWHPASSNVANEPLEMASEMHGDSTCKLRVIRKSQENSARSKQLLDDESTYRNEPYQPMLDWPCVAQERQDSTCTNDEHSRLWQHEVGTTGPLQEIIDVA